MKTLVLGGVRSGKSAHAESLAKASGLPLTYIATATAGDDEMRQRIDAHRRQRDSAWHVVEEPFALAAALRTHAAPERCVLVDCLTLWLSNLLCHQASRLDEERTALLDVMTQAPGNIVLVGNETGLGIVPLGELTRRFTDEAGRLHQALAQRCDRVVFMVAGLPMVLKEKAA